MASEMSINAYARYRDCRPYTVQMAIKRGRIKLNANNQIDPDEADRMWDEKTNPLWFSQTPKLLINWGLPPFFRFRCPPFLGGPYYGFRGREILAKLHHLARLALLSGDRRAQRRCEPSSVAICTDVRAQGVRDDGLSRKPTSADSNIVTSAAPHKAIFGGIPSALVSALARPD